MRLEKFARHPLLFGPSPLHPLERLTKFLGGAEVWAKREDCNSGLAYGGNKTRKLEYLVAEALAQVGLQAPLDDLIDAHGEGRRRVCRRRAGFASSTP